MALPKRLNLLDTQTTWAAQIDPVIQFAPNQGLLLKNQSLKTGANVINHLLGRQMQGWIIVDRDSAATIYRSQPLNNLTLTLTASAPVNLSLWVF